MVVFGRLNLMIDLRILVKVGRAAVVFKARYSEVPLQRFGVWRGSTGQKEEI
jgi:hypothetical protein